VGSPLLCLPLRRREGWGTPVPWCRFVDRFRASFSGDDGSGGAASSQGIKYPRLLLHLVGEGVEGLVGGVFLRSVRAVDLLSPGSVGMAALPADLVEFLFLRPRPCPSGIFSDVGVKPGGVVQELSGRRSPPSSWTATAAVLDPRVLRSAAGGCWQAELFCFFDCVEWRWRFRDLVSTGRVPADEPQRLGLAVGEPLNRLTKQFVLRWCSKDLGVLEVRPFLRLGFGGGR
jgi:hypothetical protein